MLAGTRQDLVSRLRDEEDGHRVMLALVSGVGNSAEDLVSLRDQYGLPLHLVFAYWNLLREDPERARVDMLDSIPFHSLCKGLFLPMLGMQPREVMRRFDFEWEAEPLRFSEKQDLMVDFLEKDCGLDLKGKMGCITGDVFLGGASYIGESLIVEILAVLAFSDATEIRDELGRTGDLPMMFVDRIPRLRSEPQLTAREVLTALRHLKEVTRTMRRVILQDLFDRCGKLEAYFLAKLALREARFGYEYNHHAVAQAMARMIGVEAEMMQNLIAISDIFHIAQVYDEEGIEALEKIQVQPLNPLYPALASDMSSEDKVTYPCFLECKYDGVRLQVHKQGNLVGAYTRRRNDWTDLVPGLGQSVSWLPAESAILDGELHCTVFDLDGGSRQGSVYDILQYLKGERSAPVNLKYTVFDVLYFNGTDLTKLPFHKRRQLLGTLVAPLAQVPVMIPIALSEGEMVKSKQDLNRLFQFYRRRGFEGGIAKTIDHTYQAGVRTSAWKKKKEEKTLDLVITGALWGVGQRKDQGFGSFIISARDEKNNLYEVGSVVGMSAQQNLELMRQIMARQLITGQIERVTQGHKRAGVSLAPNIVAMIKYQEIVETKDLRAFGGGPRGPKAFNYGIRSPRIVTIRNDKTVNEVNTIEDLEEQALKGRYK